MRRQEYRSCDTKDNIKVINVFQISLLLLLVTKVSNGESDDVVLSGDNAVIPTVSVTMNSPTLDLKPETTNQCFYANRMLCLNKLNSTVDRLYDEKCECFPHPTIPKSLICCNITDITKVTSCIADKIINETSWTNVHIYNATFTELNVSDKFWKLLDSLIITDGTIKNITSDFKKFSLLKCLNVSNNNLIDINERAFKELTHLGMLDISHNNLSVMPRITHHQNNLFIDIRGNSAMLCKSVLEAIDRVGYKFVAPDTTYCVANSTYSWFNTTETIPIRQLERVKQLQAECPSIPGHGNCTCESERMSYSSESHSLETNHLIFTVKVDCSGLQLKELPKKLPANTLSLNVSNNFIKSLSEFNTNKEYSNILRLYADNNLISDITEIEGTNFIAQFQILFLKNNKLKAIPFYIIANTLDRNPSGRTVHLGGNRLTCDCYAAKEVKKWLVERQVHIIDYDQIYCDNMPNQKLVDLSETKLCQSQHDWTDYIYFLIAAEVLMLMALIMKVSYDYWIFKTAGYLPWPANKMPKLPCDWLCES